MAKGRVTVINQNNFFKNKTFYNRGNLCQESFIGSKEK